MELLLRHWRSQSVQLVHVRTTLRRSNAEKGRWDFRGVLAFCRIWWRFVRTLWRWRPHVVFLLLSSSWWGFVRDTVLVVTARSIGAKVLVQYRGGNFAGFYSQQSRWRRRFIRWGIGQVQRVLVQSEGLREQFCGLLPQGRLGVLPNGIPVEEFPQRRRCIAAAPPFRLLFVGHIAFAKGFRELLRAYRRLSEEMPVELWVIGTRIAMPSVARSFLPPEWRGYYERHWRSIEAEIDQFLEAAERWNVRLLGVLAAEAVREWMAEADLFVLPSYSEGFSMAVLEAMGMGLPVVVTPVGALKEVVQDGVHGRIVPVGDESALCEGLRACLEAPEQMRRWGEHAREYVREHFALERVVCRLEAEMRGLAS